MAFLLLSMFLLVPCQASGSDKRITLDVEDVSGEGFELRGIQVTLDISVASDPQSLGFRIDQVRLAGIDPVAIECSRGRWQEDLLGCDDARVLPLSAATPEAVLSAKFEWEFKARQLRLVIHLDPARKRERIDFDFDYSRQPWQAVVKARELLPQTLLKLESYLPGMEALPLETYGGTIDFDGVMNGHASLDRASWTLSFNGLGFSDTLTGEWAGDALSATIKGRYRRGRQRHSITFETVVDQGEALTPWTYIAVAEAPLTLDGALTYEHRHGVLQLENVQFKDATLGEINIDAVYRVDDKLLQQLVLQTSAISLQRLYSGYFQPVVTLPLLSDLDLHGETAASIEIHDGRVTRFAMELNEVYVEDKNSLDDSAGSRFAIYGLNGVINTDMTQEQTQLSRLDWDGGHLLQNITIGSAELVFELMGSEFRLAEPLVLPVFDGKLILDTLYRSGEVTRVEGVLTPVSMENVSHAFGWPTLHGKISGVIPEVSVSKKQLDVDGTLLVKIFDGKILLHKLHLEDLFDALPVLETSVELEGLNLETLTSTFEFGKITGTLDGKVGDLRLESWKPVRFDAFFYTPDDDPRKHRISQKAVDNISNIGGGGLGGALSSSFMGFFEEFGYSRLGISCRLENAVCEMGGVEEARDGYYLVVPGGIPRIAIIGFNRTTDWSRLLQQLSSVTNPEGPVVE